MRASASAVAVAVAGTLVAATMLASASHLELRDADDTRGVLDIRIVKMTGTARPLFSLGTYDRWRVKRIYDRGYVLLFFDTFGSSKHDYYALIRSLGYKLDATLWRDRDKKRDFQVARLAVGRRTRRNVLVKVRLGEMIFSRRRPHYSWYAQTLFTSDQCRRVCFDFAPDTREVVEPNPFFEPPVPTPTPSVPTPTPSVTVPA